MACTEAYKEHIEYTFNAFCRVVIRYAAINAWRDRDKRRQREISFEYLTEEKFYPFSTSDKYFTDSYKQYSVMICGQRVILTNVELAEACPLCRRKRGKSSAFTFLGVTHSRKPENYTDAAEVRRGITYTVPCKCCKKQRYQKKKYFHKQRDFMFRGKQNNIEYKRYNTNGYIKEKVNPKYHSILFTQ